MTRNQLLYIFKNFQLLYDWRDFESVSFGGNIDSKVVILKELDQISVSPISETWKSSNIPFLYNSVSKNEIITMKNNQVIINYDILSPIFYLLSGKQEIDCNEKDKYGRFEFKNSAQFKYNFTSTPLVNYYFDILKTALEKAYETQIGLKNDFTICFTHDIDEVTSAWKHRIRLSFEKKQYIKVIKQCFQHFIKPFFPWKNLEEIVKNEKELGIKSTFFFLTNNNKVDEIKNADYRLESPYIKSSMELIEKNNFEIGLHGCYKTHDHQEKFISDMNLLKSKIKYSLSGNRFHFLQWKMDKTPSIIEQSGLEYDSSLGFQEHIGFRNGICTPFYLYDFKNEKSFNFIEIPLSIMDCSLAYEKYMGLSTSEARIKIYNLINETKKWNGAIVINWHNTFVNNYNNIEWKDIYWKLLKEIKKEKINTCTLNQIAKQYKN